EPLSGFEARPAVDVDRADVQQSADSDFFARVQDVGGGVDDGFLKDLPRPPVADAGGAVIHSVAAVDGGWQRVGPAQVALGQLDAEAPQPDDVAAGPDQGADALAAGQQLFHDVTAEQARRPGHQISPDAHTVSLLPTADDVKREL